MTDIINNGELIGSVRSKLNANLYQVDNISADVNSLKEKTDWSYYKDNWSVAPTLNTTLANGKIFNYNLNGVIRYRFVPSPYIPYEDSFYGSYVDGVLGNKLASRGGVVTAQRGTRTNVNTSANVEDTVVIDASVPVDAPILESSNDEPVEEVKACTNILCRFIDAVLKLIKKIKKI